MKRWRETTQVLDRLAELSDEGSPAALATIVRVRGSAYRREGAKLLVARSGATVGNVSGGCLEQDVRDVGLRAIARGVPQTASYCSGADELAAWDLGVGCEGEVTVFVDPGTGAEMRDLQRTLLRGEEPFAVCTPMGESGGVASGQIVATRTEEWGSLGSPDLDSTVVGLARGGLGGGVSTLHTVGDREIFIDRFRPPPRLTIVGASEDARPLARLGVDMGFRVLVVDRRPALLTAERFAGARTVFSPASDLADSVPLDERCYAVVMTHRYRDDLEYLRELVAARVAYIGVLGPRQRTDRLLSALGIEDDPDDPIVRGPVGLDLGAEGAEQVALSIIAEILAVSTGREATPLRDLPAPIHAASF